MGRDNISKEPIRRFLECGSCSSHEDTLKYYVRLYRQIFFSKTPIIVYYHKAVSVLRQALNHGKTHAFYARQEE